MLCLAIAQQHHFCPKQLQTGCIDFGSIRPRLSGVRAGLNGVSHLLVSILLWLMHLFEHVSHYIVSVHKQVFVGFAVLLEFIHQMDVVGKQLPFGGGLWCQWQEDRLCKPNKTILHLNHNTVKIITHPNDASQVLRTVP